jgi:phosphopantothenoylcysteine synthetase/decarboxylase
MTTPIVLGVTGSIAAYKSADLVSRLRKDNLDVQVVMTRNATAFVGPLTFQTLSRNPVLVGGLEEESGWKPAHIDLADRAALVVIAPATADVLAKIALGLADDALTSLTLATRAPLLIAPAMNGHMWNHPATRANLTTLRTRGVEFVGPDEGMLACGYEGVGRMASVDDIAARAVAILKKKLPPH